MLSDDRVWKIKTLMTTTDSTNRELADSFNVSIQTIYNIRIGKTYSRVKVPNFTTKAKNKKINLNEHIDKIIHMRDQEGLTLKAIAEYFKVSSPTISRYYEKGIKNNERRR